MQQAIHIFLKDSRQLRVPIAISLAFTVLFAATGVVPWLRGPEFNAWDQVSFLVQRFSPYILMGAWLLLVSLAFQTEAFPGDRQFWLTRPYSRGSLAAAKVLFVLAYVTLPMTLAQAAMVVLNGVPLLSSLPGLVWEQVLISVVIVVPGAALAAITSGLTHFVLCLSLVPVLFGVSEYAGNWYRLEWLRTSAALIVLVLFAASVLRLQFTRRRTRQARTLGLAGILAVTIALVMLPWRVAFAVQEQLGSANLAIQATFVPLPKPPGLLALVPNDQIDRRIWFHFAVAGAAADTRIKCEGVDITVESPSGEAWRSRLRRYPQWPDMSLITEGCLIQLRVPESITSSPQPVHVRAALYVTVFGSEQSTTIAVDGAPVLLPGSGVCRGKKDVRLEGGGARPVARVECRTAFFPPSALLVADRTPSVSENGLDSYSPFPAFFSLGPIFFNRGEFTREGPTTIIVNANSPGAWLPAPDTVTAYSRPAVAHIRLDVDAPSLNLADYDFSK